MSETLDYLSMFARFPLALRRASRHRVTLDGARRLVRQRMEQREANFLRIVERSVYGYPRSPYLGLLKQAGCEFPDVRALVKQKGLEGALRELRAEGVYVEFEEFKGRRPIIRNGTTIPVSARDFDNPFARRELTLQTGGSTGLATAVNQDLDYLAATAPYQALVLSAHGAFGAPSALWSPIFPGSALRGIIQRAFFGSLPQRWFSPTGWRDSRYWLKYDLATFYMFGCMRLGGMRVPMPERVRPDQALVIARALAALVKQQGRALLYTGVSRALRVCLAAEEAGVDLSGTFIRVRGEPVTDAKTEAMRRVGAHPIPGYGMTETGGVALGCARPTDVSDVHLLRDAFALISHPYCVQPIGVTVPAFNLTTLLDTAPKLMLNVQVDDYGIVEERACGCELESYGYCTHLRDIHSYSKLVGEGVTLIGNEMLRILEEVLPARFGGSALDYQLLEQEDAQGFTRLYLLIHPRVPIADEQQVIETIHRALRESSPMADAARGVWQQVRTLQIKRMEPVWTQRAKLMPLHIQRRIQEA